MCSRHEHVQAVVARLNAGEHMPEVKLGGSLIGKTGIADVVTPLKENVHVRHVNLASNGLNEFGARIGGVSLALATMLGGEPKAGGPKSSTCSRENGNDDDNDDPEAEIEHERPRGF